MAFRCGEMIVKACEEGVELFSTRYRQWTIADIKMKGSALYYHCKNSGHAVLREGEVLVFGGYRNDDGELYPSKDC